MRDLMEYTVMSFVVSTVIVLCSFAAGWLVTWCVDELRGYVDRDH